MDGGAFALALAAAVLHAGWNVLLAGARDSVAAAGALLLFGALLLAPAAALTGGVSSEALPFVAGSAALELVYFFLLARAYRGGELGVVYPVARGVAPVVVLVPAVLGLGRGVSWLAGVGVVLVAAGVLSLAARREVCRVVPRICGQVDKPRPGGSRDVRETVEPLQGPAERVARLSERLPGKG